jgi:hypothetical protein
MDGHLHEAATWRGSCNKDLLDQWAVFIVLQAVALQLVPHKEHNRCSAEAKTGAHNHHPLPVTVQG